MTSISDDFVKSPDAALRCILCRCGVPKSTPHSSGFARLACELFTKPSENRLFTRASISDHGFTLIELLVVMAIAALGISLVTPNMIRSYENFKVTIEERRLADLLSDVRMKAFLRDTAYTVRLDNNVFLVKDGGGQVDFAYLTFPPQEYTVNGHGFADLRQIQYQADGSSDVKTMENGSDGVW